MSRNENASEPQARLVGMSPFPLAEKQLSEGCDVGVCCRGHVTYLHIHNTPAYSLGIFMLPAGTSIPLHNHPGMTVVSQLLFGSMHLRAYDPLPSTAAWANNHNGPQALPVQGNNSGALASLGRRVSNMANQLRQQLIGSAAAPAQGSHDEGEEEGVLAARLVVDRVVTSPSEAMVLYPDSE